MASLALGGGAVKSVQHGVLSSGVRYGDVIVPVDKVVPEKCKLNFWVGYANVSLGEPCGADYLLENEQLTIKQASYGTKDGGVLGIVLTQQMVHWEIIEYA